MDRGEELQACLLCGSVVCTRGYQAVNAWKIATLDCKDDLQASAEKENT